MLFNPDGFTWNILCSFIPYKDKYHKFSCRLLSIMVYMVERIKKNLKHLATFWMKSLRLWITHLKLLLFYLPKPCGIMLWYLTRPKFNFLAITKKHVWQKTTTTQYQKSTIPTGKHWALEWFFFSWTWALIRMEGIMNNSKYQSILVQNIKASATTLKMKRNFTFQHVNDQANLQINKRMTSPKQVQAFGMAQSESRPKSNHKSGGFPGEGCAQEMSSQSDGVRMLLQGRMAKYC